ncbi:hypothetical protein X777_07349 [Ooceraea biroi]|uniref:Uncharacterized protein n=1 Tax=Ooceraea biroi TaxID=2015173 RepID=A0A026X121_OOCBI|nr:hypothetical protein X777_07349 [Ooceraea biroi]
MSVRSDKNVRWSRHGPPAVHQFCPWGYTGVYVSRSDYVCVPVGFHVEIATSSPSALSLFLSHAALALWHIHPLPPPLPLPPAPTNRPTDRPIDHRRETAAADADADATTTVPTVVAHTLPSPPSSTSAREQHYQQQQQEPGAVAAAAAVVTSRPPPRCASTVDRHESVRESRRTTERFAISGTRGGRAVLSSEVVLAGILGIVAGSTRVLARLDVDESSGW